MLIIRQEQESYFEKDLVALRATDQVDKTSALLRLHPMLHEDGTVRV